MRYFILICLIFPFLGQSVQAQDRKLKAYLDHKTFYAPELGNYIEVQLQFIGHTLNYKGVENGLQGEVGVQFVVKSANGSIFSQDAYRLNTPVMRDSIIEDFYDIKRFALEPGNYEVEVSLQDMSSNNPALTGKIPVTVKDFSKSPAISDIQIAEVMLKSDVAGTFNKSGYDIIPRISNYFPTEANSLPVYFELYAPQENQAVYGLKQTLKNVKNKTEIESFTRFSKFDFDQIQPVIRNIDITTLRSGEFVLEFTLINKESVEIATTSYYFERTNENEEFLLSADIVLDPAFQQSIHQDSVLFFTASLIPISKPAEVKNILSIIKKKDAEACRKYIQSYWTFTATTSTPYDAWISYKAQVNLVQRLYSNNFMRGYETDRGRVYLQYGAPNSIIAREVSPSDYPYEIWIYDKIKQFSNRRFVFYNPDLVNNAYRLLHSDMVGELQNYRWQQALAKRNSPNRDIDDPNDGNTRHFGGNSKELYDQR